MAMYMLGFKIGDVLYSKEYNEVGILKEFNPPQEAVLYDEQYPDLPTYCNINECVLYSELQKEKIKDN